MQKWQREGLPTRWLWLLFETERVVSEKVGVREGCCTCIRDWRELWAWRENLRRIRREPGEEVAVGEARGETIASVGRILYLQHRPRGVRGLIIPVRARRMGTAA